MCCSPAGAAPSTALGSTYTGDIPVDRPPRFPGRLSFCPHGLGCAGFFAPCSKSHFNGPLCVLIVGVLSLYCDAPSCRVGPLWGAVRPCSAWVVPLHSGGHPAPIPCSGQIPARFCVGFCVGSRTFPGGSLRGRLRVIVAAKVARFLRKSR